MTVRAVFDEERANYIAKNCGSKSVKGSIAYLRRANFNNPSKFVCEFIDEVAFFAGSICRSHFRLYEIAVLSEYQGQKYGMACMMRIIKLCKEKGLDRITLRVSKSEGALGFYKKYGGTIVGDKQEDWEVEIKV